MNSSDSRYSNLNLDDTKSIPVKYKVVSIVLPIILVTASILVFCTEGDPNTYGMKRDIFTYVGSTLGIFGTLAVIISNQYMVHWRQHPNPLIFWKAVADLLLAVVASSSQSSHKSEEMDDVGTLENLYSDKNADDGCLEIVAAMTQFCILSSETWFFIMALDLFFSLQNPFTSYKSKYPKYHITCWGIGASTAIALCITDSKGVATADICWVDDAEYDDNEGIWQRNKHAIAFLYSWMTVYFCASIIVFCMAVCRLSGGLQTTYQSRKEVLSRTSLVLFIFMLYWAVMFSFYYFGVIKQEKPGKKLVPNTSTTILWSLLPAKGFVTAIVWFSVNSLPSFLFHLFSPTGRNLMKHKKKRYVGGDFSPQLNKSLRREVLHFTTKGIIEAVSKTPCSLPSNWAMLSLVSRCEMSEFDVEMENKEVHESIHNLTSNVMMGHDDISNIEHIDSDDNMDLEDGESGGKKVRGKKLSAINSSNNNSWLKKVSKPFLSPIVTTRRVKFKDFCPHVFARIREAFGISSSSYIQSLRSTAKEKLSEGASGAFMFFTGDGKYVVKSTTPTELSCLLRILVPYAEYLVDPKNRGCFLTRFYGCHSIRMYGRDYSFVVMANIFNTTRVINNKYDIKGSWVSRNADPIVKGKKVRCRHCNQHYIYNGEDRQVDEETMCSQRVGGCQPNVVLKDNDLNEKLRLEPTDAERTIAQLIADSELLGSLGIMDYSLIVGVCKTEYEIQDHKTSNRWPVNNKNLKRRTSLAPKVKKRLSDANDGSIYKNYSGDGRFGSNVSEGGVGSERNSEGLLSSSEHEGGGKVGSAGNGSLSFSNFKDVGGGVGGAGKRRRRSVSGYGDDENSAEDFMMRARCVVGPEFFYMGVIDMLQAWTMKKKIERFAKIVFRRVEGDGLSAIEPMAYKKRFQNKVTAIFEISDGNNWIDSDIRSSNQNSPARPAVKDGGKVGGVGGAMNQPNFSFTNQV